MAVTLDNRKRSGTLNFSPMKFAPAVWRRLLAVVCVLFVLPGGRLPSAHAEAMLQLFNVSWSEVARKMPELAEAGYNSLWLPPPAKASGGLSVGYDLWDPYDLGSKDQRNTVRTRYGTEADLLYMMEVAHRLGIRVYFDKIMNHRAFDVPGFNENTPIGGEGQTELYPGMVPEDFHLRKTEDGFYRKWDNTRDWGSAWQVQNLGLSDLIDIAHETPNANFGPSEGSTHPKFSFVRDLERPGQYDKDKDGNTAYFGILLDQARAELGAGATDEEIRLKARAYILANRGAFVEDVGAYLIRAARWTIDRTKADGFRLDAVKHVPDYFFGQQSGTGKDTNSAGYLGGVQWQFNRTRGFSDANHRDSVFEDKVPRDDALAFGEHLGQPPGYGGYWDAGMRLVDNDLRSKLNGTLGNPGAGLQGLDAPGAGGFPQGMGVTHANSHDSDFAALKEWQHAFYMTREGMGLIYSDGYNKAETLGESGGAFPRHANTAYLGQFGDPRIPNILKIHNDFARGLQQGLWADGDFLAFERRDNRNPDGSTRSGNAGDEITMVVMMNDNTTQGQSRAFSHSFGNGAYLHQYARGPGSMTGFYSTNLSTVTVPPGGYFVFSWRTPELSTLWPEAAITLYQSNSANGRLEEVPRITVTRQDGRDGDASFNPDGLDNRGYPDGATPVPYTYQTTLPVVKGGSPLTILARADGSAANILVKLDGGVNLNTSRLGTDPAWRDNPPGLRTDTWLGYEQPLFVDRQHPEKFAAKDTARCKIGSARDAAGQREAETYVKVIGGAVSINNGPTGANNYGTENGNQASWVYHDPADNVGGIADPPQQLDDAGAAIIIWAKSNSVGGGFKAFVYYTLDGSSPEGAGGIGRGTTRVAELNYRHSQTGDDWWGSASIPKPAAGTVLTYKIGFFKNEGAGAPSWWPASESAVSYKKKMLTTFRVADFDPATVQHFPHNDYARVPTPGVDYTNWPFALQTGLSEGFHVLRARAFLNRGPNQAPLYNTFVQTFYYDAKTPDGELAFPAANGETVGGSGYEMVVRTDMTVEEVWYSIADSETDNDDAVTRRQNGNGAGFEPFADANNNGVWNEGETFTDLNGNGSHDTTLNPTWARATEVTPSPSIDSPHQKEWRFTYNNIPVSGAATIKVRLLEASSSRDLSLGATAAHVREITRSVQTLGNAERLLVAFPANDGDEVDDNYIMRVWFPKTWSNVSITPAQMMARFTFLAEGNAQDRDSWSIDYGSFGPGSAFHQLSIPLPNLYNSAVPQQEFRVVYRDPGDTSRTFTAIRRVTVNASDKPFLRITRPTVVGPDGRPTELILPDGPGPDAMAYLVQVETDSGVTDAPTLTGIAVSGDPVSETNGNIRLWSYTWNITAPGSYVIEAEAPLDGVVTRTSRNASVVLRQIVEPSGFDGRDDDNDGLVNIDESNRKALPAANAETWSNGDVHIHFATGRSLPTSPDSDSDGLPDGLEVGWRTASSPPTDLTADSNGDGSPNFIGDLDPPLYAAVQNHPAVPGVGSQSQGDDRARQAAGSVTDPLNPDTDGDGIPDGVEDANRNGWTDGDGKPLQLAATINQYTNSANRPNLGDWPNNTIESFETWQETTPAKADSDGDGLNDGNGEDQNFNGRTDIFLKAEDGTLTELLLSANPPFRLGGAASRAINYTALFAAYAPAGNGTAQTDGWPKIVISETDPLRTDTDGDGQPDGWEVNHGLDPLDNGTYSFREGGPGNINNGSAGDPDNDGLDNASELANGTHPNQSNTGGGGGAGEGAITIGSFTDWTHEDLLVLDEYNEGGSQRADVYRTNANDNSRDIVAFSFRDGGAASAGGDGRLYFRVDFMDLAPNAWQGQVDAYIVIDNGNPAVGERAVPNEVDIATDMRWEAVVAAYGQDLGSIFIDTNRGNNTIDQFQNPASFGVISRGFGTGRDRIAWSSSYDAVEISVDRQHLIDAGWGGNPDTLNFQVFSTMPNTIGSGSGDIPGRNDIRDTIDDDWLASDFWRDQDNIRINGKLSGYFGRDLTQGNIDNRKNNDRYKNAKVVLLAHGNQAIDRAETAQGWVRRGTPAVGYSRLLETHEAYNAPLTLHITPTLASALQWAKNPNAGPWPNNDGPTFNDRIRALVGQGKVSLVGSTFADHVPKYFQSEFNTANKEVAEKFLDTIYGNNDPAASRRIFWPSERVLDHTSLEMIKGMGYGYTFADQMRHFVKWFGRPSALGTPGYRLNEVNGMKIFPIHDVTSEYLDSTLDEGTPLPVRQLLSRRSRSGTQDQVVVLWRDFDDFSSDSRASSYDANIRWLAGRPWIRLVTAGQIADGQVQYPRQDNGQLTGTWGTVNHGAGKSLRLTAKDWVDWATNENYDNWFNKLKVRTFTAGSAFGQVGVDGHADAAWNSAKTATAANLQDVARAVVGGAMFQIAFYLPDQAADLSKYSTGDYINPASLGNQAMADFARNSQGQARFAHVFGRVQQWAASADASTHEAVEEDVDLDGQPEYLLFNSRVFAVFEARGGRMTAAWMRHPTDGKVWQVAGNFASYGNTDTEDEGASNETAFRTSGFKDWSAISGSASSSTGVNADYNVAAAPDGSKGWTFTSGGVSKTITLPDAANGRLAARYTLSGPDKLRVRFGLSPNLLDLLIRGQEGLTTEVVEGTRVSVANAGGSEVVRAWVEGPQINATAVDTAATTTVQRRNQAQTHQVEVEMTGAGPHLVTLGFDDGSDAPAVTDGIPDTWWNEYNVPADERVAAADRDGDDVTNMQEYVLGSDPNDVSSGFPSLGVLSTGDTFRVSFPTVAGRRYTVMASSSLTGGLWTAVTNLAGGQSNPVTGDGTTQTVTETGLGTTGARFYRVLVELGGSSDPGGDGI